MKSKIISENSRILAGQNKTFKSSQPELNRIFYSQIIFSKIIGLSGFLPHIQFVTAPEACRRLFHSWPHIPNSAGQNASSPI